MSKETERVRFSDRQWNALAKELPRGNRSGDARGAVEAMLYAVRTGIPWKFLPADVGDPAAVEKRFNRWVESRIFPRAYESLFPYRGQVQQLVAVDGKYIPVHLEAHGARKSGPPCAFTCDEKIGPLRGCPKLPPPFCPRTQAIGRNACYSTLLIGAVNQDGLLLKWELLAGNRQEHLALPRLLRNVAADVVVADGAYNNRKCRRLIVWGCGGTPEIPGRKDCPVDSIYWRKRNLIERAFNPLLHYRRVATRYDKTADAYNATVALAAIRIGLRRRYPGD